LSYTVRGIGAKRVLASVFAVESYLAGLFIQVANEHAHASQGMVQVNVHKNRPQVLA
jgi:hypothetical protein